MNQQVILLGLFLCSTWAMSKNTEMWRGKISDIQFEQAQENEIILRLVLEEYTEEGKFPDFEHGKIVFLRKNEIALEYVDPDRYKDTSWDHLSHPNLSFITKTTITSHEGSVQDIAKKTTPSGQFIYSSRILLESASSLAISVKSVDKNDTSRVTLAISISQDTAVAKEEYSHRLELTVADFEQDRKPGNFLGSLPKNSLDPKTEKFLQNFSKTDFVTLVYKAKYIDVVNLFKQADLLKSSLGQVSILEDSAKIIVRDRPAYVLEILRLFADLDQFVAQVTIVVQILERTCEDTSKIGSTFQYLKENGAISQIHLQNQSDILQNNNVSGVYSHLSADTLQRFAGNINAEIREGKAKLKALTTVRCQNRKLVQFNSGNSIPYYQQVENSFENSNSRTMFGSKDKENSQEIEADRRIDRKIERGQNTTSDGKNDISIKKWQTTFIRTGINLEVSPSIRNSDLVELNLKASYSEITSWATSTDIPVLSDRSLNTFVSIQNGDTIIIGGLFSEKEIEMRKGIPLLMDIPGIGVLFSSRYHQKIQTEIIFVLTVYIHSN